MVEEAGKGANGGGSAMAAGEGAGAEDGAAGGECGRGQETAEQTESLLEQMAVTSQAGESSSLLPQLPSEVARPEQGKWEDKGEATLFKHSRPLTCVLRTPAVAGQ